MPRVTMFDRWYDSYRPYTQEGVARMLEQDPLGLGGLGFRDMCRAAFEAGYRRGKKRRREDARQ